MNFLRGPALICFSRGAKAAVIPGGKAQMVLGGGPQAPGLRRGRSVSSGSVLPGRACPHEGQRDTRRPSALSSCLPLGLISRDCWQEQPWGKGDFAVTAPRITKLPLSGPFPLSAGPNSGVSSPVFPGFVGVVALWGFGLFRFNESLVVKYPQQRADHKNQHEGYLP